MRNYKGTIKFISIVLFIIYLSFLIYSTFFDSFYGRDVFRRHINIVPFKTIIKFLTSSSDYDLIVINIVGNVVAFMPMGFFLPIIFTRLKSVLRIFLVSLVATLSIEIFQYVFGVGTSDIDDVILNVFGGIMGYLVLKIVLKLVSIDEVNNIK